MDLKAEHDTKVHVIHVIVQAKVFSEPSAIGDDDDDASIWREKWGSQLPCEVSAERMSGFRET